MKKFPSIQQNIPLASYTTFKIGGPAKYFYEAKTTEDLVGAIKMAKKENVSFFILGGGGNVLVSDRGFNGLVIKITSYELRITNYSIVVDAGVLLNKLIDESIKADLTGLEWAAGIPGTVGGAIRGNAGAFGASMSDIVKSVRVLKIPELRVTNYELQDLEFGYRDSIFKKNKNLIILSAELKLEKGDREKSEKLIKEYLKQRKEKQPLECPSAGSIFKNPNFGTSDVSNINNKNLRTSDVLNIGAGYLIEQCGLKGKKIGKAMISEKHANFIINAGGAKANDIINLINLCKEKVKEKFGIELEEEIEYIGNF